MAEQGNKDNISLEELNKTLEDLIIDPKKLENGYNIITQLEMRANFYMGLLKIIFESSSENKKKIKLSGSILNRFLKKNYEIEGAISSQEKLNIVSYLLSKIDIDDYYIKNLMANILGFIAAKEFPNCYESFIKILINKLAENKADNLNEVQIDTILRIFINVLKQCDDQCAIITGDVLPVIIDIFKISKTNQKIREKCLIIISHLLNKLSYADGYDMDLLSKALDTNSLMENSISLFTSILVSNPKMLLDIKKYTIRILDILVRDMPCYSSKFFNLLIEPTWRLIVLELSLYCSSVVFGEPISFSEEEEILMEEENHEFSRGYESEDEEEIYGMEGVIRELIDFAVDLLKRGSVIEALRPALYTFLLCIKGYILIPHNSYMIWKNDPNLYITEEYDEENINSVRSKTLGLIREISKEIDDDSLLNFIHLIISEFTNGINIDNYKEVIRLDDYNLVSPYLAKLNSDKNYIYTRQESNLLILGTISDDLLRLKEKQSISLKEIESLINYLLKIIENPDKENPILCGRAVWSLSKLLCLVRNDTDFLINIFEAVSHTLCNKQCDLSIKLVSTQCISSICQRLIAQKKDIDSKYVVKDYDELINLLEKCNDDTLFIPIENILYLTKSSPAHFLHVPSRHLTPLLRAYAARFDDAGTGTRLLELLRLWSADKRAAPFLVEKFVPVAVSVFEDFFRKKKGGVSREFEEVKNTVMTEHSNPDIATSSDMLPNLIDIINMLLKYCAENKDNENMMWISLIVKSLCDILIISNDVTILQKGCSLLRFYIALGKETILRQKQVPMILNVINRYFDPNLMENSMLYLGNVICQFFFHLENKIIPTLLENIVKRIYKAKMPSIVQSLILVYARFLVKFPDDTLNFLISIQVENRVGLKVLVDKWLLHQPLFRGKYIKNVSIYALTKLYSMKNQILESLMVIGYNPSHSSASVEVNAPCKILSVLIRCLNNEIMQEKIKNEKTNYDEMGEKLGEDELNEEENEGKLKEEDFGLDEDNNNNKNNDNKNNDNDNKEEDGKIDIGDDEFKDIHEEPRDFSSKLPFLNNTGKGGGLNNLEQGSEIYLTEMLGFDYNDIDNDEDENIEEDLEYLNDIDANFVLKEFIMNFFKEFIKKDEEYLTECLKLLPKEDQKMFKSFGILPGTENLSSGNSTGSNEAGAGSDTTSKTK